MKVLELALLKTQLEHTLAECRDAYPVPEVGAELEASWGQAMDAPASVGAYVKACAASQQKEIDALKAELEAEREESKRWLVKAQNERDARKDLEAELDRVKALEPVAEVVMTVKPPNASPAWLPHKIVYSSIKWIDEIPVGTKLYALGSKTA